MLQISSSAVNEIKRIQRCKNQPDTHLKLSISPGGCSGLFYDLRLENAANLDKKLGSLDDLTNSCRLLEIDGISLIVDYDSWQYIESLKIDYAEDLMGGGFRFHNSQVKNVCGCGISFTQANPE
jgi:iron-sulfur cluster assembly protein